MPRKHRPRKLPDNESGERTRGKTRVVTSKSYPASSSQPGPRLARGGRVFLIPRLRVAALWCTREEPLFLQGHDSGMPKATRIRCRLSAFCPRVLGATASERQSKCEIRYFSQQGQRLKQKARLRGCLPPEQGRQPADLIKFRPESAWHVPRAASRKNGASKAPTVETTFSPAT